MSFWHNKYKKLEILPAAGVCIGPAKAYICKNKEFYGPENHFLDKKNDFLRQKITFLTSQFVSKIVFRTL